MTEKDGEQADVRPTLGDVADMKMTLKIWDVPPELGRRFIGQAKASYANKSWLLLQDLMQKADRYDLWMSSGKMAEIEGVLKNHEVRLSQMEAVVEAAEKTAAQGETAVEEKKTPKTFGGQ